MQGVSRGQPESIVQPYFGEKKSTAQEVQVKQPTLTYKLAFLIGGISFAGITYVIGTWLYEIENLLARGEAPVLDYAATLRHVVPEHVTTLIPWLLGTTVLSIGLGYLFDKQIKFRKRAEELQARAELLAVVDGLTQLYNHSYFIEQLGLEIKRTQRHVGIITLLLLDLDDFKKYNDTYGHLPGDELLKRVARTIKATIRETDLAARYGGEEFVVIAQGMDKEQGKILAERLRQSIELSSPVTVSIGVASYPGDGETIEQLIQSADQAMYCAKREGKNRVTVA